MDQISLADYRQQIEETIEERRYVEAVAHGRHILKTYPQCINAYWLLGKAILEAGQHDQAIDMFRRVLSADPEHVLAWVGMSEMAKRRDELEHAIWYLERAFELATDNDDIARELRHLYGELEGSEPKRLQLTKSALAKLYLRADLLTRATTELRKLTEEHPDRSDLRVALAEALWRHGQRLEATQVCQDILGEQPYALKANLILGEIWTSSGSMAEGEPYLEQAEALDPDNETAQELFGSASPLPPKEPQIEPLDYPAESEKEGLDWVSEMEKSLPVEAGEIVGRPIGIPSWLQEPAGEPAPEAAAQPEEEEAEPEIEAELEGAPSVEPAVLEEKPSGETVDESIAPEEMPEEDALTWLDRLATEAIVPSSDEALEKEEIPAWLAELESGPEETAAEADGAPEGLEPELADIPEWLQDLASTAKETAQTAPPKAPVTALEEERPTEERSTEGLKVKQPETDTPGARDAETKGPEVAAPEEMAELPDWLESNEMPSDDDALAWLAQLAEGRGEELPAQPEIEDAAHLTEIMDRPGMPTETAEIPAADVEAEAVESEPSAAREEEEVFGWTAFAEREAAVPQTEEPVASREKAVAPAGEEKAPPAKEEVPAPEKEPTPAEKTAEAEVAAPPLEEEVEGEGPVPEGMVPEEDLYRFIATQRAYTQEHPDDYEAQLELGRVLWQADMRQGVVEAYEKLIKREKLLDDVIADLEDYTKQWQDARVMQALGDAYVKADRLQNALDIYGRALASL